jgi:superfamily I DNA/RNA helicase
MKGVYIPNYEEKMRSIRRQHSVIRKGLSFDSDQYEDDLPNFLKELSEEDLETMISEIEDNRVPPSQCVYKLYTIHGYKGLEDDNVRIADDIDTIEEVNLWYVALTRGRKLIVEDTEDNDSN